MLKTRPHFLPFSSVRKLLFLLLLCCTQFNIQSQNLELSVQTGHSSGINDLCYHSHLPILASAGSDGKIVLWNLESSRQLRELDGHGGVINNITMFKDIIISSSDNGFITFWNISTGKLLHQIKKDKSVKALVLDTNNQCVYAGTNQVFKIDLNSFKESVLSTTSTLKGWYNHLAIGNNTLAASNIKSGEVLVWDIETFSQIKKMKMKTVSLSFDTTGSYLYAAGQVGKIRRWNILKNNNMFNRISLPAKKWTDSYLDVDFDASKTCFAGANRNGKVYLYDAKSGDNTLILKGHQGKVWVAVFDPTGKYLTTAGDDGNILFWNVEDGQLVKVLGSLTSNINDLDVDANENFLISGHRNGQCKIIAIDPESSLKTTEFKLKRFEKLQNWKISVDKVKYLDSMGCVLVTTRKFKEKKLIKELRYKEKVQYKLWDFKKDEIYSIPKNDIPIFESDKHSLTTINSKNHNLQEYELINSKLEKGNSVHLKIKGNLINSTICYSGNRNRLFGVSPENKPWSYSLDGHNIKFLEGEFDENVKISLQGNYLLGRANEREVFTYDLGSEKVDMYNGKNVFAYDQKLFVTNDGEAEVIGKGQKTSIQIEGNVVCPIPSKTFVAVSGNDAIIHLYDLEKEKNNMAIVPIGWDDKMFVSSDNYYFASKGSLKGVSYSLGTTSYGFEQFDLKFNRPDIILQRLKIYDEEIVNEYTLAYEKRLERLNIEELDEFDPSKIPTIEITEEISNVINTDQISIPIMVEDPSSDLHHIKCLLNGVPVYGRFGYLLNESSRKSWSGSLPIQLSYGKNNIQISVVNKNGIESLTKELQVFNKQKQEKPNLYIVSIGVSKFLNKDFNLTYAAKDATDIVETFESVNLYNEINKLVFADKEVKGDVLNQIESFTKKARVNDVLIFFVASHGVLDEGLDYYIAAHDMDFNEAKKNGISYSALENLLDNTIARKKVLFLDACHSGEFDKSEVELTDVTSQIEKGSVKFRGSNFALKKKSKFDSRTTFELSKMVFADLRESNGAYVISSAGGTEIAIEGDEWKNGLFTYCLIQGLVSKDADLDGNKKIMISELQKYIFEQVEKLSNGKQMPTSRVENLKSDFRIW